nr:stAR-related lipid transfer protein 7, mitochondrial-like [Ipomoea batatas]
MEVEWWVGMVELVNKPAVMEAFVDILVCIVPIWMAVMIGLMIGWSWRPRWTGILALGLRAKLNRIVWTAPPGFGARRLWFAFTAVSAFSVGRRLWNSFRGRTRKPSSETVDVSAPVDGEGADWTTTASDLVERRSTEDIIQCITGNSGQEKEDVTENDLEHFLLLLDGKDGEMAWQSMMERSTSNMTYQAWRHEAENGPPGLLLRSKTVFEDATPELVRDFFWDDEFRPKWDPMLAYFKILQECSHNGFMIVHWIKKFPFFCSDREYIIGKRIWESGRAYYCVTKSVPYPALSKRDKPRRVDVYFSSWVIRPVESQKRDGQFSACEVTLTHYEDMGIPKDVAKLGVRHGMWGTVKKLHAGFRAYQNMRKTDAPVSRCATMAGITTKLSSQEYGQQEVVPREEQSGEVSNVEHGRNGSGIDWKWVVIGGTVALVSLHTGLLGKALLIGAGQRVGRKRGNPR